MLFLTYWELNEEMSVEQRLEIAETLTEEGHFPPDGVEIVRWDLTPDGWGIVLTEADSPAAMHRALLVWRASGDGFFEITKTAPVQPVREAIPNDRELLDSLG